MRVLVTGHDGYIGSVLVPILRQAGHEVVGLDTGLFADCVLGPAPEEVKTLRVDLRDVEPSHVTGFDAVMHLAALCNDPLGNLNPDLTYDVNHRSTIRLAKAAKAAGVQRFLFSSSCSLYGKGADDTPLDETAGFQPVTPYGESKILSEQGLLELADDDFSPVFLRNSTAYGFSPGCAATWSSTTSPRTRCSPGRSGCCRTARPGGPWSTSRTSPPRSWRCWRSTGTGCTPRRTTSARAPRTT
ncbi:hypothetical protein GCM10027610_135110 [Dactylosporangium cerinum]